jgi:hypothetical protein
MIVVEDSKTYELRKREEHLQQRDEFYRKRAALVHPFKQHVLDIVQEAGDEPIKITSVANRFARETGHSWKSRDEREDLKKQAFAIIGELIKGYLLERYGRQCVKWTPPDNSRRRAFLKRVEEGLKTLPKPNITF